jgi:hypothetical protein
MDYSSWYGFALDYQKEKKDLLNGNKFPDIHYINPDNIYLYVDTSKNYIPIGTAFKFYTSERSFDEINSISYAASTILSFIFLRLNSKKALLKFLLNSLITKGFKPEHIPYLLFNYLNPNVEDMDNNIVSNFIPLSRNEHESPYSISTRGLHFIYTIKYHLLSDSTYLIYSINDRTGYLYSRGMFLSFKYKNPVFGESVIGSRLEKMIDIESIKAHCIVLVSKKEVLKANLEKAKKRDYIIKDIKVIIDSKYTPRKRVELTAEEYYIKNKVIKSLLSFLKSPTGILKYFNRYKSSPETLNLSVEYVDNIYEKYFRKSVPTFPPIQEFADIFGNWNPSIIGYDITEVDSDIVNVEYEESLENFD